MRVRARVRVRVRVRVEHSETYAPVYDVADLLSGAALGRKSGATLGQVLARLGNGFPEERNGAKGF